MMMGTKSSLRAINTLSTIGKATELKRLRTVKLSDSIRKVTVLFRMTSGKVSDDTMMKAMKSEILEDVELSLMRTVLKFRKLLTVR
jgi:hypothetical protein